MYYYINSFYLYSFLGYIYENLLHLIIKGKFLKNVLYEPIKPIYGIGLIIIIIIERFIFNRIKVSKRLKIFLVFITTIVVLTALEGISGVILEKLVHKVLWNYSDMKFNLGKYICLEVSFVWGIMSIVFLYVLKPFFDKVLKKIPVLFSNIMLIITITDILLSLIIRS